MISFMRHKQSTSWTFLNDAIAISAKEIPKNHTDAATSSCIEIGILTLLFRAQTTEFYSQSFISHRILEAVVSRILKSLLSLKILNTGLFTKDYKIRSMERLNLPRHPIMLMHFFSLIVTLIRPGK